MPKGIPKKRVNKGWFKKGHKINVGRKKSEEQIRKFVKTNKRLYEEGKRKPIRYWLGKKRDKTTKEKIRKKLERIHCSLRTEFKKGNIPKAPIKKGEHRGKNTEFKRGRISHNKGKTYEDLYEIEKVRKIKEKIKKRRAKQIFPKKDSSIEVKIQNFLKKLGIEFFTHQHMNIKHAYQCDIFIPIMNLVIECDGDYWHSYPTGKEIDHIRTKELVEKGFKVLRLWEFEIKEMNLNDFKDKIKKTNGKIKNY